jgi:polyisoprenoid-binding protein YceI
MSCRLQPSLAMLAVFLVAGNVSLSSAQTGAESGNRPPSNFGQIDTSASRVFIKVGKTGLGHEHGVEGRLKSGSLDLKATNDPGQVVFDITSFQADTATARQYVGLAGTTDADTQRQVKANMLGPDVLDATRHPTATFRVATIQQLRTERAGGSPKYQLDGDFTLHGTTRPIRIIAESTVASGYVRLHGTFNISQTDYGITPYSKAFGTIGVADKLTIWGDLWIVAGK